MLIRIAAVAALAMLACWSAAAADQTQTTTTSTTTGVTTSTNEPATTPAVPIAGDPKDRMICKNEPPPTGSRVGGRRICATQREWDQMAANAQKLLRDQQLAPVVNRGVPGTQGP
jgi:hypothetical protein